ncbi:alpha/beta hydrolase family protein [Microbacter margulisiae]|uniref:Dipeptidyl aminopeptidase/acylaminoacyl peptidase n=1 Tax=Microbacter margulisiae TaxID=1350067 RepID=A0A7W5H010_9PORP|nr:S9 family peptidase [Microbacter margulisiae]MBB3186033.1 dipeptidyl aminopeptidase/acylaminoacyl peptidase [Microbacter margulisiae]
MRNTFFLLALFALVSFSCNEKSKTDESLIEKPTINVKNGLMTPEALWAFGRIGDVSVSPDAKTILFSVTYYSISQNKGNTELYTMNIDGTDVQQITKTRKSESNPAFNPNGKRIGFLYPDKNGDNQFFEMNLDGSDRKQISDIEGGIEAFRYAPDGKQIVYIHDVKRTNPFKRLYKGLKQTSGRINDDLMYRHWDQWVDSYPQPYVADFDGKKLSNDYDLLGGTEFESPMRPFGGIEQIVWSPDSKTIAYTCRKKVGKAYSLSTNSDIYLFDVATKTTQDLSEGIMGYDMNPVYSPDGSKIAWESMDHDGYESDKSRIMIYDFANKTRIDYSKNFDQDSHTFCWDKDNQHLYFTSPWHGVTDIFKLNIANDSITRLTNGVHDYLALNLAGNQLIATRQSMSAPTEIYAVNTATGKETQLSDINKSLMAKLNMGKVEARWVKTTDNKQMLVWVIYPPNFDATKKYPALLYCQGGPQDMVSQFWSYRWNFQIMAANGYIVVAPNRRGLPGFGEAWNREISGDYGGQNMKDYISAIDAVAKEPYVNKDRLGCVGASYGGFSVYWLAGHNTNKRFKVFIAHDGFFNMEQQYLETDEMWFANWDLGGPYWDKKNPVVRRSYANSPHLFVDKWNTPIMVVHSQLDYRIVNSQGMAAYNAAVLRGIPALYLYFPDESHFVLKPQNAILWQRTFFDWLDKWLKDPVGKDKPVDL